MTWSNITVNTWNLINSRHLHTVFTLNQLHWVSVYTCKTSWSYDGLIDTRQESWLFPTVTCDGLLLPCSCCVTFKARKWSTQWACLGKSKQTHISEPETRLRRRITNICLDVFPSPRWEIFRLASVHWKELQMSWFTPTFLSARRIKIEFDVLMLMRHTLSQMWWVFLFAVILTSYFFSRSAVDSAGLVANMTVSVYKEMESYI